MVNQPGNYISALEDFRHERRMAALQEILGRITGKPVRLLSYSDISTRLKLEGASERGLQEIPIDAIVGSVGRYSDFTRSFLPRRDKDAERWARVKSATSSQLGLPPIEVYKIGDAYFVRDGHHRVSVARQQKTDRIQAYVTEVRTKVPLTPDISPDELILKSEYADLLERTHIDDILPDLNLNLTVPGSYRDIEEHIQVHCYYMGVEQRREIPFHEAVRHWYENVYLPVIQTIRERGVLREFPGRTESDLYLWISVHRGLLEKELGWHIRSGVAAASLAAEKSPRLIRVAQRIRNRLIDRLIPDQLEDNPTPGAWIQSQNIPGSCLFLDILVPLSGEEVSWNALEQALILSSCSGSQVNGLHVVAEGEETERSQAQAIKNRFEQRCLSAGIQGTLSFASGEISRQVVNRAPYNDLVVLNIAHPPGSRILDRFGSGLRTIIRRCARPILAVPGKTSPMDRLLLAYDGSLKANEALFVSTYFAGKMGIPFTVLTVIEPGKTTARTLQHALGYLEARGVAAEYVSATGPADEAILKTAQERDSNFILMGGYGFSPVVEAVLGSSVDRILREAEVPVLICQ